MQYTDKQIDDLLSGIFDGSITDRDLPEDLYTAISEYLQKGLYIGYGKTLVQSEGKDLELLSELRNNVYMFGAAKTYQETKDISSRLIDENGDIRSRGSFLEEGRKMFSQWNDDWGKSEYNTAIAIGTMSAKWNTIEDQRDIFPILRYSTIGDACEICGPLDGFTAKIDDPAWDDIYPANHFNCRCTVLQEDETVKETPEDERAEILGKVTPEMDPIFMNNAGKTGTVFPEDHPYFKVQEQDRAFAADNFGLPMPDQDPRITDIMKNVDKLENGPKKLDTMKLFTKKGTDQYTEARTDLHEKIVKDYLASGSTKTGTSYFMGGAPATGKSSILEKGIVELPKGIKIVDPDAIKAMIPEYNELVARNNPLAAYKAHEESSILSKSIVKQLADSKADVHLDGVGDGSYAKLVEKVAQQRAAGQKVEAYYVTTNVEVSVSRAEARALKTGRRVPEEYIREMHTEISNLVPKLAENGIFDVLKLYDNNVAYGEKPILIFEQTGKKIIVHDKKKYADFLSQGSSPIKKK